MCGVFIQTVSMHIPMQQSERVSQSAPTLDRARCGKVSITRLVSSPDFPANWPLRIRAAVTVVTPMPGSRWKHT